ncbi:GFA family protein [Ruegeria profundi]|uniref:CENP-V/GFA domain-containing protein n=1 Tax=Ruegeria profundi TaxID=1685378 RepID=A0A0X3TV15_9RHOB|nr:GFA family protein [Ruegeria profundi]KUJ79559.1 hypothetical protein AVO44_10145 [Ruegeria profundi]
MIVEGGCYCGAVRYRAEGEPIFKGQCHCRACQHVSGGGPNLFVLLPRDGFKYIAGAPKQYTRTDRALAVTREFCADCGTHLTTLRPGVDPVILKIGTLDDPSVFGGASAAVFVAEKQDFHVIPDGMPSFEGMPPM